MKKKNSKKNLNCSPLNSVSLSAKGDITYKFDFFRSSAKSLMNLNKNLLFELKYLNIFLLIVFLSRLFLSKIAYIAI